VNRRQFLVSSACACLATTTPKIKPLLAQGAATNARLYRCGTPPPTPSEKIQANRVVTALRAHRVNFRGTTVVPIRFHIIHKGTEGYLPDRQLKVQVALLNSAYAPASIQFKIVDVALHENNDWFYHQPGTDAEVEMKTQLGRDTAGSLNLYIAEPGGLLGYATFPWWYADSPQLDGVVIHHASLPEAERPWPAQPWPFDLGMTAVHEIGHWSGLYHTFQGGCEAPGDDVADTAYEATAATGCPLQQQPSSCPGEARFNPVENYMDYSDDACMKQFTPMQYQRMKDMVGYYRYKLNPQTSRSTLLEQIRKGIE
jgi:hypothetical protein